MNALEHEGFHQDDYINKISTSYTTHANVYLKQMKTDNYKNSSKQFKETTILNFFGYLMGAEQKKETDWKKVMENFNQSNINGGFQLRYNNGKLQMISPDGKQDFKYNGKECDSMHGLNQYDYSARFYDLAYARFTTMDPHSENYYAWSPYAYVANNPMRLIDSNGKDWFVNNENGNLFFLKGVNELTQEHREKYNLGDAQYENLGTDNTFGSAMNIDKIPDFFRQKEAKGMVTDQDFLSLGAFSEEFMNIFDYVLADKLVVKSKRKTEFSTDRSKHITESKEVLSKRTTYVKSTDLDTQKHLSDKVEYFPFSNLQESYYEIVLPWGHGQSIAETNKSQLKHIGKPSGYFKIIKEFFKAIKK